MSDYTEHPELPAAAHERWDVPPRLFALGLAFVGVALVLTALLVIWIFPVSLSERPVPRQAPAPAAPALQSDPRAQMTAFFRSEMQSLNGVWWVDRKSGRVHIPIAEAMHRVAEEGIADWPKTPVDPEPREETIRLGTPRAGATESGLQRNVRIEDTLPEARFQR